MDFFITPCIICRNT